MGVCGYFSYGSGVESYIVKHISTGPIRYDHNGRRPVLVRQTTFIGLLDVFHTVQFITVIKLLFTIDWWYFSLYALNNNAAAQKPGEGFWTFLFWVTFQRSAFAVRKGAAVKDILRRKVRKLLWPQLHFRRETVICFKSGGLIIISVWSGLSSRLCSFFIWSQHSPSSPTLQLSTSSSFSKFLQVCTCPRNPF